MKINTHSICTDLMYARDVSRILKIQERAAYKVISIINKKLQAEGKITYAARVPYDSFIDYLKGRKKGITYADYKSLGLLNYKEVALILHIQPRSASNLIQKLNKEMKAKGKIVYPARIAHKDLMIYLKKKKRGIRYADYQKSKK